MTPILHHLCVSQSERIVWLLEELNIPYTLRSYTRAPLFAPAELKNLPGNSLGTAPVLQDGDDVTICETGAIVEYLLSKQGSNSSLTVSPSSDSYSHYLYWLHAANGTLQPQVARNMTLEAAGIAEDNPSRKHAQDRLNKFLGKMDARLSETGAFLAGQELTAADIVTVFSLTTMRYFYPYSLKDYQNIVAYLDRIGARPTYRQAMEKGDPGMELLLGADPPKKTFFKMVGGWK